MNAIKQVYLLQMRQACAAMEHANQCAARETQHGDGWTCDWNADFRRAGEEFEVILSFLKTIPNWQE